MQKENFQRMKYDLPRGQFCMSINLVSKDLNITFGRARGLIKKFTETGIITNVYTPPKGCKKPSIWQYNSAQKISNDDNNESNNESNNDKSSNINGLSDVTNNDTNNESNNDINNSKKEYIKRNNKKNINSHFKNDQKYLEIFNYWNEKNITHARKLNNDIRKGIDGALNIPKDDDGTKVTVEDIKQAISNYAELYNLGAFTYKWRLVDFLKRRQRDTGTRQILLFLNDGTTYINCKLRLKNIERKKQDKGNNDDIPKLRAFKKL